MVYLCDDSTKQLHYFPLHTKNKTEFGVVAKSNEIVICGGMENGTETKSCYRFIITDNR